MSRGIRAQVENLKVSDRDRPALLAALNSHDLSGLSIQGPCFETVEHALGYYSLSFDWQDDGTFSIVCLYDWPLYCQDEVFEVIAPFAKDGAVLTCHGEDGAWWRWEIWYRKGRVIYDEPEEGLGGTRN